MGIRHRHGAGKMRSGRFCPSRPPEMLIRLLVNICKISKVDFQYFKYVSKIEKVDSKD